MTKYRKKPVDIDAILWTGDESQVPSMPKELRGLLPDSPYYVDPETGDLVIQTLEGEMRAKLYQHYIIRGVAGELYPLDATIFAQTYEEVKEP
jgi:hypothetical protein